CFFGGGGGDFQKLIKESELNTYDRVYYYGNKVFKMLARLGGNVYESLNNWVSKIESEGGWVSYDELGHGVSSFSMMTAWQISTLIQNAHVLQVDSTHNTYSGRTKGENVYLVSIVCKNKITGRGLPVCFMLTNSETYISLRTMIKLMKALFPEIVDTIGKKVVYKVSSFTDKRIFYEGLVDLLSKKVDAIKSWRKRIFLPVRIQMNLTNREIEEVHEFMAQGIVYNEVEVDNTEIDFSYDEIESDVNDNHEEESTKIDDTEKTTGSDKQVDK
ncbi:uncharacterized protein RJT21DRAFT_120149, partial [Scheffersomyces amazonensis]|uniref:uncharacterized protein n=1 Tax=Scheffersomyces amazonensis TaxID=1078765 RepID=UPI00315C9668